MKVVSIWLIYKRSHFPFILLIFIDSSFICLFRMISRSGLLEFTGRGHFAATFSQVEWWSIFVAGIGRLMVVVLDSTVGKHQFIELLIFHCFHLSG